MLLAEFPGQQASLDAARVTSLAALADGPAKVNGLVIGRLAAQRLLARRAEDGRNASVPYTPGSGRGAWIPTPPDFAPPAAPFLARVDPFTMTAPAQFRPPGPPPLGSERYATDYHEVKELGGKHSTKRTREQTATGVFWAPSAATVWPVSIRKMATDNGLDLIASARFQAAAFTALADSLIACWDAKYAFNFWRPVTAIRVGDSHGDPKTAPDPQWEPFDPTPAFPEYPSGHCCLTSAVGHVMSDYFANSLSIPARNVVTGEVRIYKDVPQLVDEVTDARMLIGVHFRFANVDGAAMGKQIALQIRRDFFAAVNRVDGDGDVHSFGTMSVIQSSACRTILPETTPE